MHIAHNDSGKSLDLEFLLKIKSLHLVENRSTHTSLSLEAKVWFWPRRCVRDLSKKAEAEAEAEAEATNKQGMPEASTSYGKSKAPY